MIADMLRRGRCARGLLTAALLTLDPATIAMLAAAAMLAPDGRCKTLDASADGYVPLIPIAHLQNCRGKSQTLSDFTITVSICCHGGARRGLQGVGRRCKREG